MLLTFLIGILGVSTGALITWRVVSQHYERASRDLRYETQALRGLTQMILRALQSAGLARIKKDKDGAMIDLVIDLREGGDSSGSQSQGKD